MNHRLVTELLARAECWKLVEFGARKEELEAVLLLVVPDLVWEFDRQGIEKK